MASRIYHETQILDTIEEAKDICHGLINTNDNLKYSIKILRDRFDVLLWDIVSLSDEFLYFEQTKKAFLENHFRDNKIILCAILKENDVNGK